jgi:hypothetical protein
MLDCIAKSSIDLKGICSKESESRKFDQKMYPTSGSEKNTSISRDKLILVLTFKFLPYSKLKRPFGAVKCNATIPFSPFFVNGVNDFNVSTTLSIKNLGLILMI